MSITVPGAMSTAEARKIAEQLAAIQNTQTKEDFRVEVLLKLQCLMTSVKNIEFRLDSHEKKFGTVNQSIDDSKGLINKIVGGFILAAALGGLLSGISKAWEMFGGKTP